MGCGRKWWGQRCQRHRLDVSLYPIDYKLDVPQGNRLHNIYKH